MRECHQSQSYPLLITAILNSAARLNGLEEDLHLTGQQFNTLISVMFVGYTLTQVPSYVYWLVGRVAFTQILAETYSSTDLEDRLYTFLIASFSGGSFPSVLVCGQARVISEGQLIN